MNQTNYDDTMKLSPRVIDVVRTGGPRGCQSEDLIISRDDSGIKGDSNLRRELLPTSGFGYLSGRFLD